MALDTCRVAQVAIQSGRHAAGRSCCAGRQARGEAVHYHDKGNMATVSRLFAVQHRKLRLSGFVAWVLWLVVHLVPAFKHRLTRSCTAISFVGRGRSERVTAQQVFARAAMEATPGRRNCASVRPLCPNVSVT